MRRNLLKRYALSSLALLTLIGCAQKTVPVDNTPWSAFMYNDERTNASDDKLTLPLVMAWKNDISAFTFFKGYSKEQLASPVISNNSIYTGSTDENFYSFDLSTGSLKWKYGAEYPLEAPAAITEERVFFGSADGILRCVDKNEGKEIWRFQAKSEILSSPVVRDGNVYFSSSDDRFYALNAKTGEKVWNYSRTTFKLVTPRIYGSPAYSNGKIFNLFSDGSLVAFDGTSGKELWSRTVAGSFDSAQKARRTPLVADGIVYMLNGKNEIEALSAETGEVRNTINIIKAYDFILPDKRTIVIAGADQAVSLDRLNGSILWKKDLSRKPVSTVFAADGHLFVLSNYKKAFWGIDYFTKEYGYIEAISLKDGSSEWGEELKSSISSNGLTGESRMALLTDKGILKVYRTK
ncbi:MAG: PQQ-like beta-propeller repeat protein [Deltaproteobacteria bacterium]|nr:PQQ-like beta-propeller repeat protein [Deltaproteobacteria bacterium]